MNRVVLLFNAVALVLIGLTAVHFYNLEKANLLKSFETKQLALSAAEKKKDEVATDALETKYETITKVEIQYVDRIVTKEVIKYRDAVPVRCVLDSEWVRIYNLSAEQAGTENPTSEPNGASGTTSKAVDDAHALEVVTTNNRICVAEIEKLTALQEWAKLPFQKVKQ